VIKDLAFGTLLRAGLAGQLAIFISNNKPQYAY